MKTDPIPARYHDLEGQLVGKHTPGELTEMLVKAGVPRAVAEQTSAKRLGLKAGPVAVRSPELEAAAREEKHLLAGDRLVLALGGRVYRLSQPRASKQSLGLPDRLYVFAARGRWYTWEAKASWGRMSEPQRTFSADAQQVGIPHVVGELASLYARFQADGLCVIERDGTVEPIRE